MNNNITASAPRRPHRFAICLDGTWNTQGDGTNILALCNLITDGPTTDGWHQKVYYDTGVGTGLLDSISGGAFGAGLGENVCQAYEWLMRYWEQGDEVFVFGFSRGAFTARSLVSFLDTCGLLRPSSPMNINELWAGYRSAKVGLADPNNTTSKSEADANVVKLARLMMPRQRCFRPLTQLLDAKDLSATEVILKQWSRLINVRCIGVFDTVGAMGLDALAIPGVKDFISEYHNMNLSPIVENGFHALAIDEHRNSFAHTSWQQIERAGDSPKEPKQNIKQCWFVGAHSNIGGGYEDNLLALMPLHWMITQIQAIPNSTLLFDPARLELLQQETELTQWAQNLHRELLKSLPPKNILEAPRKPFLRDSYEEFGSISTQFMRAKRNYRRISQPPQISVGQVISEVGMSVHPSVWELARMAKDYAPPNLHEYVERSQDTLATDYIHSRATETRQFRWLNASWINAVFLLIWCVLGGWGYHAAACALGLTSNLSQNLVPMLVISFMLALTDGGESRLVYLGAKYRDDARGKCLTEALYWGRAWGVLLAVFGLIYLVSSKMIHSVWQWMVGSVEGTLGVSTFMVPVGCMLVCSVLASKKATLKAALGGLIGGVTWVTFPKEYLVVTGELALAAGASIAFGWILPPRMSRRALHTMTVLGILTTFLALIWLGWDTAFQLSDDSLPGLALFTMAAFLLLLDAYNWTAHPLNSVGLGSIWTLQRCSSAAQIESCLAHWHKSLTSPASHSDALIAMAKALRGSIWRDTVGLIPIYTIVMGFGIRMLYFLPWLDLPRHPLWLWIPLTIAALDLIENTLTLHFLGKYEDQPTKPKISMLLAPFYWAICWIKNIAVALGGFLLPVVALVMVGYFLMDSDLTNNWRAILVKALVSLGLVVVFIIPAKMLLRFIIKLVTGAKH